MVCDITGVRCGVVRCSLPPQRWRGMAESLALVTEQLAKVVKEATAASVHSSRRAVFHFLTDAAALLKLGSRVRAGVSTLRRDACVNRRTLMRHVLD